MIAVWCSTLANRLTERFFATVRIESAHSASTNLFVAEGFIYSVIESCFAASSPVTSVGCYLDRVCQNLAELVAALMLFVKSGFRDQTVFDCTGSQ